MGGFKTVATGKKLAAEANGAEAQSGSWLPRTIPEVLFALDRYEQEVDSAETYAALRKLEAEARVIERLFAKATDVKRRAQEVVVLVERRIGEELAKEPVAKGGGDGSNQHKKKGSEQPVVGSRPVAPPTLKERGLSRDKSSIAKRLAKIPREQIKAVAEQIASKGADVTSRGIIKAVAGEETKKRREESREAMPLADGMVLRIGDCRKVLADVADNSVPLILTDPPYGDEAEPLYRWLAEWASRVLIPGGSLICYTGQARLNRDIKIFDERLRYWWLLIMEHQQSQRLAGKFVIANFKPVLWYVKDHRRGRTLMPDVLKSPARDKDLHNWGQGEGGVSQIIEHLTDPGELIVDPFAGTAAWGRVAAGMGRRWIGADVIKGGASKAMINQIDDTAEPQTEDAAASDWPSWLPKGETVVLRPEPPAAEPEQPLDLAAVRTALRAEGDVNAAYKRLAARLDTGTAGLRAILDQSLGHPSLHPKRVETLRAYLAERRVLN